MIGPLLDVCVLGGWWDSSSMGCASRPFLSRWASHQSCVALPTISFCLLPHWSSELSGEVIFAECSDTRWRSKHSLTMLQLPNQIIQPSPLNYDICFIYTYVVFLKWGSHCGQCAWVCICMFFLCVIWRPSIETEDVGHPSLPVFTLSLNSRPATGANGALICSWMTRTCCLRRFPNNQWPFRATLALRNHFFGCAGTTSALSHCTLFAQEMLSSGVWLEGIINSLPLMEPKDSIVCGAKLKSNRFFAAMATRSDTLTGGLPEQQQKKQSEKHNVQTHRNHTLGFLLNSQRHLELCSRPQRTPRSDCVHVQTVKAMQPWSHFRIPR